MKRSSLVAECKTAWLPYYSADITEQLAFGNKYVYFDIRYSHILDVRFSKGI